MARASDIIWRHVSFDVKADTSDRIDSLSSWAAEGNSITVAYDFDTLCNEMTFRNALVEVFDSTKDRLAVGTEFYNELLSLRSLLEETLQL